MSDKPSAGARHIADEIAARNPFVCGPCGGPLPNPDCGHRKNGRYPVCIPQTDDISIDIALTIDAAYRRAMEDARTKALEARCERGTPWDLACIAIAKAIGVTLQPPRSVP